MLPVGERPFRPTKRSVGARPGPGFRRDRHVALEVRHAVTVLVHNVAVVADADSALLDAQQAAMGRFARRRYSFCDTAGQWVSTIWGRDASDTVTRNHRHVPPRR
jgi:hypothetical protein